MGWPPFQQKTDRFYRNVQKFSIHDGEGIRTLIFMKGCPLRCVWCCNPESQSFKKELLFVRTKCIGCGVCIDACLQHGISREGFIVNRELCDVCGSCAKVCVANAKKEVGRWVKKSEMIEEIEKDRIVYKNSGGGVTIGGGEPTSQSKFVRALLKDCTMLDIHTAIETCGYGEWQIILVHLPKVADAMLFGRTKSRNQTT
ncbi:MAG: glycyl-radical enzyme activating protein [Anaerovorax sp.]